MPSRSRPTVDRAELAMLRERTGLTLGEIADLTHASDRAVESWFASDSAKLRREMPFAVYELLLLKLGIIQVKVYTPRRKAG
jgi:hypothetical protein